MVGIDVIEHGQLERCYRLDWSSGRFGMAGSNAILMLPHHVTVEFSKNPPLRYLRRFMVYLVWFGCCFSKRTSNLFLSPVSIKEYTCL